MFSSWAFFLITVFLHLLHVLLPSQNVYFPWLIRFRSYAPDALQQNCKWL